MSKYSDLIFDNKVYVVLREFSDYTDVIAVKVNKADAKELVKLIESQDADAFCYVEEMNLS